VALVLCFVCVLVAGTAGTATATRNVSSCTTIDTAGEYQINRTITNGTTGACVEITTGDVVLDGQGNVVDGTNDTAGSVGVDVRSGSGVSNVTVRNVTTENWATEIAVGGNVNSATIADANASANGERGLRINGSDATVTDTLVARNGPTAVNPVAVEIRGDGATFDNVTVRDNSGEAINAFATVTVRNSTIEDHPGNAVELFGSANGSVITNTTFTDVRRSLRAGPTIDDLVVNHTTVINQTAGIDLRGNSATVEGVTVRDSSDGIRVSGRRTTIANTTVRNSTTGYATDAADVTIRNSTAVNNSKIGFDADTGSADSLYVNLDATANGDGYQLAGQNNTLRDSTALRNDVGIDFFVGGRNVSVVNVTVRNSSTHGIYTVPRLLGEGVAPPTDTLVRNTTVVDSGTRGLTLAFADNVTGENVTLGSTTADFEATDVNVSDVSPSAAPAAPSGQRGVGTYVDASNTTADGYLDLTVEYRQSAVSGVDEGSLAYWSYDGSWTERGGTLDAGANTIRFNFTSFSTLAPLGQPPSTDDDRSPPTDDGGQSPSTDDDDDSDAALDAATVTDGEAAVSFGAGSDVPRVSFSGLDDGDTVTVRQLGASPDGVPDPENTVLTAVDIETPDTTGAVTVRITVSRGLLDRRAADPSDVVIERYDGEADGWVVYDPTVDTTLSSGGARFEVTVEDFSVFAVTVRTNGSATTATATPTPTATATATATATRATTERTDTPTATPTATPGDGTPTEAGTPTPTTGGGAGFGLVTGLVGLLAAALLLGHHRL
jgi:hypothetical protein